jgi:putative oxidoreductase
MGSLQKFEGTFYALMRIVVGGLFALHGAQKMFGWPLPMPPGHTIERFSQGWFGGIIELVCGGLVAVGLFTRYAAFLASGTMAVAYFQFHKGYELAHLKWLPPVNGGEPAVIYCFIFLYIAARGAGRAALDKA